MFDIVNETPDGPIRLVVEASRIDASNATAFRDACVRSIATARRAEIDLGAVRFIDSSGLGALVAIARHLGADGELRLTVPDPGLRSLFEITRMDRVLNIQPAEEMRS